MKKPLVLLFALLVIVALSACDARNESQLSEKPSDALGNSKIESTVPNSGSSETISREHAIELALQAAGVDKASAFDIEAELDRERGGVVWEVDFETREYEYSYDINANDGSVVRVERERND